MDVFAAIIMSAYSVVVVTTLVSLYRASLAKKSQGIRQ
jgi:hypothetical protein